MKRGEKRSDGRAYNPGPLDQLCVRCGARPGKRCRNVFDVVVAAHDIRYPARYVKPTPYVMPTWAERVADHLNVVAATPADRTEAPR
jgi:hypothetical protein